MTQEFRADLHVHSHCSDGTDDPLLLLDLAKAAGLSGLSITDHDTIQAYTPELIEKAKQLNMELLFGVEISSEWRGQAVHILAYAFNRSLEGFLDLVAQRRVKRNRLILEYLKKKGIALSEEELIREVPSHILGRPHIAQILIKKGVVSSIQEAFDRFLHDDLIRSCSGGKFSPHDVIQAIHQASGKAVLAHPHVFKKRALVKELLSFPFDGLECYYGRCLPQQEKPWLDMAKRRHLIPTGGSDYHGGIRLNRLGCSWVSEEIFRRLASSYS